MYVRFHPLKIKIFRKKNLLIMIGKNILSIIITSPFKLVREHMECTSFCAKKILTLVKNIEKKKWEKVNIYYTEINKLKDDAEYIKKNVKLTLSDSLFMNVSKTDILYLLKKQDRILNKIKYISSLLISKKLDIPLFIIDSNYYQFMQSCIDTCNEAFLIITKLEKIINNGFPKKEIQMLNAMVKKLYTIENVSNRLRMNIRKKILKKNENIDSISVICMYKVIDLTSKISNSAREIGKRAKQITSS